MSVTLYHPLPAGRPTDSFGWRPAIPGIVGAQLHSGQDYAAPAGTPVYAAHAGRVNRVWWDAENGRPMGGNMLQIGAAALSTRYAHLSGYAVQVGQTVTAGQIVGYVGSSGAANGPHLHFELILPGGFVNPVPYIRATPTSTPKARIPMPALIRHPNKSIGFVSDAGELDVISSITEVEALKATGIVGHWIQLPDPLIWDTLIARTNRRRASLKG